MEFQLNLTCTLSLLNLVEKLFKMVKFFVSFCPRFATGDLNKVKVDKSADPEKTHQKECASYQYIN